MSEPTGEGPRPADPWGTPSAGPPPGDTSIPPGYQPPAAGQPPPYQTAGQPPPYQPAPQQWASGSQLSPTDERNWAMGAHLSGFLAAWVALGLVGPLVVLLVAGNRSAFVRRHAVEALNFNISVMIYALISFVLVFVFLIGVFLLIALGILYLVTVIMGAMAASRGQEYRYPMTIRLVK